MSFLESVLFKNRFNFISILDFQLLSDFFLVLFILRFFLEALFLLLVQQNPWDRSGGILLFKVVFLFKAFLKNNRPRKKNLFYSLKSSYVPVLAGQGLAESTLIGTPYSVREWCRFLTKLSRLLSKSDCFQLVSFDTLCNPLFRCRGVSIISFACVVTDSSTLKNSQTAAEGLQSSIFVLKLCLLADLILPVPPHSVAEGCQLSALLV